MRHLTQTVLFSVAKRALVHVACVRDVHALTIELAVMPLALAAGAVGVSLVPAAASLVVDEHAVILRTVFVRGTARSVFEPVAPFTFIHAAVVVYHDALTVRLLAAFENKAVVHVLFGGGGTHGKLRG